MSTYYLLLGSNIGNRADHLEKALQLIQKSLGNVIEKSSVYETEAWGLEGQPNFLNQACTVKSEAEPEFFLKTLKDIELQIGRKPSEKWGPRIIDIDILYIDDKVIEHPNLKVPHPGVYDRNFVLIPMIEIAGDFIDPVRNVALDEIYDSCVDTKEVYLFDEEDTSE